MTSIKTLSDKAILISVSISCFTGLKKDKGATNQVANDNNISTAEGNVRVSKNLMKGKSLAKVLSAAQKIRLSYYAITAGWGENVRICKVSQFQNVKLRLEKEIREFNDAVTLAVDDYQNMIDADRVKLGSLFNEFDYPSRANFAASFSAKISVAQVEKSDFRNNVLSEEDINEINQQIADRIKENSLEVEKDLVGRVQEKLNHLMSRLLSDGKFHASALESVTCAINEARNLNINDNQKIEELFDKVEQSVGKLVPEAIRISDHVKNLAIQEVKADINAVSDMMSEFMC